jgi:hypothetical protein
MGDMTPLSYLGGTGRREQRGGRKNHFFNLGYLRVEGVQGKGDGSTNKFPRVPLSVLNIRPSECFESSFVEIKVNPHLIPRILSPYFSLHQGKACSKGLMIGSGYLYLVLAKSIKDF